MLTDNLTVKSRANTDVTYNLVSQNGKETIRVDAAGTKAEPTTLRISSQESGKAPNQRTRNVIQLIRRKTVTSGFADLTINLTVNQPSTGDFSSADILDALTRLLGVISASNDAHSTLDSSVVNRVFTLGEA